MKLICGNLYCGRERGGEHSGSEFLLFFILGSVSAFFNRSNPHPEKNRGNNILTESISKVTFFFFPDIFIRIPNFQKSKPVSYNLNADPQHSEGGYIIFFENHDSRNKQPYLSCCEIYIANGVTVIKEKER